MLARSEHFVRLLIDINLPHSLLLNAMKGKRTSNYRDLIREVYTDRVRKNPRYSLRQFARQSGIASSTLIEVLSGKKNLSVEKAHVVGRHLGFEDRDLDYFCSLAQRDTARSPALKIAIQEKIDREFPDHEAQDLSVDHFKFISDWYHLPILELAGMKSFAFSATSCAKALGISLEVARNAISRLHRLELLETQKGRTQKTRERILVRSKAPNEALRSHHRQMLERTIDLLDRDSPERRILRTENLAFSAKKLEHARALTQSYIEQIQALANTKPNDQEILYHLAIQFFPITEPSKRPIQGDKK